MKRIYCALVHHPVLDRSGNVITTAVTNLDVHDIARSARTYDLTGYFVVTPITAQRCIVDKIVAHWQDGNPGAKRVPSRQMALSRVRSVSSLEDAVSVITHENHGKAPQVFATSARASTSAPSLSFSETRERIASSESPTLMLFGTGHGLTEACLGNTDAVIAPVQPNAIYNHLSVRAAAAIVFDRLLGDRLLGDQQR